MLGDADLVAFVATRDLTVAKEFYEQVLGLRAIDESEFAVVYDANGTRLRVARVDQVTIAPYTVLGWRVDNIAAQLAMFRRAGVTPKRYDGMQQDEDGVWIAPERDTRSVVQRSRRQHAVAGAATADLGDCECRPPPAYDDEPWPATTLMPSRSYARPIRIVSRRWRSWLRPRAMAG